MFVINGKRYTHIIYTLPVSLEAFDSEQSELKD